MRVHCAAPLVCVYFAVFIFTFMGINPQVLCRGIVPAAALFLASPRASYAQTGDGSACVALNSTHALTDLDISQAEAGSSIVSWSFPSEVCNQGFVVSLTPLDMFGKRDAEPAYFETQLQSTSIPELEYLRAYEFEVNVKLDGDRYGPNAYKIITPYGTCTDDGAPGRIERLAILADDDGFTLRDGDVATVCWTRPTEGACVDQYTLGRRLRARNDAEAFNEEYQWKFFTFSEPGCHDLKGHTSGRVYDYGIRAYNAKNGTDGPVTAAEAFLNDAWVCVRGGNGYPQCSAGEQQQCAPMDCDDVAGLGLCGAPFVRSYDESKKIVVQFCSEQCSCNTPRPEEIESLAVLGGVQQQGALVDDSFACCSVS